MAVEKKDNWRDALLSLQKAYPDATICVRPHGTSNPVKPEKATPSTDLREWQRRVFPDRPRLTGPTDLYSSSNEKNSVRKAGELKPWPSAEELRQKKERRYAMVRLSKLQWQQQLQVQRYGAPDEVLSRRIHDLESDLGEFVEAVDAGPPRQQVPRDSQSEQSALCHQVKRYNLGIELRDRVKTGEIQLQGQLDALREQARNPDVPCPCPLCLHRTPLQRIKDIAAIGGGQKPLPRPYGAKKGVEL